jgi:hypothetical protein
MALPNITVNRSQGNIIRPATSNDSVSGMIFYSNTYPSGFDANNQVKKITSFQQAYNLGIVDDWSTETKATATITITATSSTATDYSVSTSALAPLTPIGSSATFSLTGNFQFSTTTINGQAGELANAINNYAPLQSYTINNYSGNWAAFQASANNAVVSITAPQTNKGLLWGAQANGMTFSVNGFNANVSKTAFSGGVSTNVAPWAYHIKEHFRLGNGPLYVGVFPIPGSWDFEEIRTVQNYAAGEIRQIGIYQAGSVIDSWTKTYTVADVASIQTICNELGDEKTPLSVVLQPEYVDADTNSSGNWQDDAYINNLANLQTYTAPNVSVLLGQDGAADGYSLALKYGMSIGSLGAVMGVISNFKVSESIGWVGKLQSLPFSTTEYDTPAMANGSALVNFTATDQNTLADKHYTFLRRIPDLAGSFISDSKTAVSNTNAFYSIERNRTIDKARRVVAAGLSPLLNSPVNVNADGTLSAITINVYKQVCNSQLDVMVSNGELSAYQVSIDPNQNVLATDTINITLTLVPVGVARFITVDVSFGVITA